MMQIIIKIIIIIMLIIIIINKYVKKASGMVSERAFSEHPFFESSSYLTNS